MSAHRSFLTATLASSFLALSLFACTADSTGNPVDDDAFAASGESEIKTETFVGHWANASAQAGEFATLDLKAGGNYSVAIAICGAPPPGGVSCLAMPRDESGRFTILHSGSKQTLRLVPNGAPVRRYDIAFAPTVAVVGAPRAIELTRSGESQVLNEVKGGGGGGGGVACGKSTCGAGLVCCNPLSGTCTKPGMFCAQ